MLLILRFFISIIYFFLVCILGIIYCLYSPRNPCNVAIFSHLFGRMSILFGLKVELRISPSVDQKCNYIYIANHQNNYDMLTLTKIIPPRTLTVGKKSILWIPFFGLLYWLSGNLLINRNNRFKAHHTISMVVEQCKNRDISILIFPEGTRSRKRGLIAFKTGAFHAAVSAGVPIVPICVSTTHNQINLNRWNNGHVIIEMMEPINTNTYSKKTVRNLADTCHALMLEKITQLNTEVAIISKKNKNFSHI